MEFCKRSEEASVTLKLGLIEVRADRMGRFSPTRLKDAFERIEALRRSVDALPTPNEKKSLSIHLHKVYSRIDWMAERYGSAYRHLNSLCEVLSEDLSSASEDDRKRVQRWVNMLAASALFAEDVLDFEPVLKHPIVELSGVLLIFTKCDFVNFCRFKKFYARILSSVLETNSVPPHLEQIEKKKMELLERKFRSMAAKKIAATCKTLSAEVDSHVDQLMRDAETCADQMEGEINIEGLVRDLLVRGQVSNSEGSEGEASGARCLAGVIF
uniref:MIF4G domain-containing protein n=1 Tax=Steinernema glaseri TaxID=37863 RepID=A0A1I8ABD2_9BILA